MNLVCLCTFPFCKVRNLSRRCCNRTRTPIQSILNVVPSEVQVSVSQWRIKSGIPRFTRFRVSVPLLTIRTSETCTDASYADEIVHVSYVSCVQISGVVSVMSALPRRSAEFIGLERLASLQSSSASSNSAHEFPKSKIWSGSSTQWLICPWNAKNCIEKKLNFLRISSVGCMVLPRRFEKNNLQKSDW